ncbi:hypothetical protein D3C71_1150200 [compost metagenome]
MRHGRDAGDGIGRDCVFILVAREHCRVEGIVVVQDLAHDHQLARVVGAIHHQRHERLHRIEAGELQIGVVGVAHADPDVQPAVAVDDVVATAPLDDVTRLTTEDDVTRPELIVGIACNTVSAGHGRRADQGSQAADQVYLRQHAAVRTVAGEGQGVFVIAAQDVAVRRPRQALSERKDLRRASQGLWQRTGDGTIVQHVGINAEPAVSVGDPVIAGTERVLVGPFAADDDIVAALA